MILDTKVMLIPHKKLNLEPTKNINAQAKI